MSCEEGRGARADSHWGQGRGKALLRWLLWEELWGEEEEDFLLSAVCPQSMPYSRVLEVYKEHLSPELVYFPDPLLLHQGHMQWLFDHEGNRYLDFFSGIVTVSVGHCHP